MDNVAGAGCYDDDSGLVDTQSASVQDQRGDSPGAPLIDAALFPPQLGESDSITYGAGVG